MLNTHVLDIVMLGTCMFNSIGVLNVAMFNSIMYSIGVINIGVITTYVLKLVMLNMDVHTAGRQCSPHLPMYHKMFQLSCVAHRCFETSTNTATLQDYPR